jgi:hypothetical protein
MRALCGAAVLGLVVSLACGGGTDVEASPEVPEWLLQARTLGPSVDDDPCDYRNPTYATLALLNEGMASDPILARVAVATEPTFASIGSSDVGRRWSAGWDTDLNSDEGIRASLVANPGWTEESAPVPSYLTFAGDGSVQQARMGGGDAVAGTWDVRDGTVHVHYAGSEVRLTVRRAPYYLVLQSEDSAWAMDPVVCL